MRKEHSKKVFLHEMLPGEVEERKKKYPVMIIPLAPLEWHGPHLPLGVDMFNALHVSRKVAEKLGGVVYPPLFIGTEKLRRKEELQAFGFQKPVKVVGMDFPCVTCKSFYFPEKVLYLLLRNLIHLVLEQGYRVVWIISGHGAVNQRNILDRVSKEFNKEDKKVGWSLAFPKKLVKKSIAHAAEEETSLMMYLEPGLVHLENLPSPEIPLGNLEFAIVDSDTFQGNPTPEFTVRREADPRISSSRERGREYFDTTVKEIVESIRDVLLSIKGGDNEKNI